VIAPAHHNLEPVTAEPVLAAMTNGWADFDSLLPVPRVRSQVPIRSFFWDVERHSDPGLECRDVAMATRPESRRTFAKIEPPGLGPVG
jgi:hypothetical protein